MNHATDTNETRHTYIWVTSHTRGAREREPHRRTRYVSHVTDTNATRHTYIWVTPHTQTHMVIESRHKYG